MTATVWRQPHAYWWPRSSRARRESGGILRRIGSCGVFSAMVMYRLSRRWVRMSIILGATSRISGSYSRHIVSLPIENIIASTVMSARTLRSMVWRTTSSHARRSAMLVWRDDVTATPTDSATIGERPVKYAGLRRTKRLSNRSACWVDWSHYSSDSKR